MNNGGDTAHQRLFMGILSQWRAIYVVLALLFVAGLVTAAHLPEEVYPSLSFSRVLVVAESGDLDPTLVHSSITRPLEQELSSVLGVQQVSASSTQGTASITLTFDPRVAGITVALQRVAAAISLVQGSLPPGTRVSYQQVDPSLYPVLGYALSSQRLSLARLRDLALYDVKPQLLGLPGVAAVTVLGGDVREYLVSVDPQRLVAHHVTLEQLTSAIAKTNTVRAVGHTDNGFVRATILAMGQAHDARQIAAIPIATEGGVPVTVGMVAAVLRSTAPPRWAASSNGKPAVIVNVFAQRGASFVDVAKVVAASMDGVAATLHDVRVSRFWDQGRLVSRAITSLRDAIVVGLLLSTLVLYLFLREWSSTLVAAAIIPLTIVLTFLVMLPLRQGLNLMTLGGLAVGVGLIIDDAIVVVENIYRHLHAGKPKRQGIADAVREIAAPMISSTFTTIVVLAPLALLSGIPGAFFKALAITLAVALMLSMLLALLFTPNAAAGVLRVRPEHTSGLMNRIRAGYGPLLRSALVHRGRVLIGGLVVLIATIVMAGNLGTDFLPRLDEGAFEMEFRLPPGATLAETRDVASRLAAVVRSDPAIATEATVIGQPFTVLDNPGGVNTGKIRATLKPKGQRPPIWDVIARLQRRVHRVAPIAQVSTKQVLEDMLDELSNVAAPIEIRVFGPNQSTLVALATQIARRIDRVPGVTGVFSGVVYRNPGVVVRADPDAAMFGVTAADLASTESVAFGGVVVSSILRGPAVVPIRVRYDLPVDPTLTQVENIPVVTKNGASPPLWRLATIAHSPPESTIRELNGRRYLAVTAQIAHGNLGSIITDIKRQLAAVPLPPGYATQIAGSYALQRHSFAQLALAIALAVLLVFLVMLVQFRAFLQPLAIAAAMPLALFGGVIALLLTRMSLNISSLMGVILLVGLVVKNGILLLEYATRRRAQGDDAVTAIVYAAQVRLRPILMTTLAALMGMLPLAFAIGSGSEILQPLAVVVLGGLSFSTAFTLLLIPALYVALCDLAKRMRGATSQSDLTVKESGIHA